MVSIEELRRLIPGSNKFSDAEMRRISDIMDGFADAIFNQWLRERNKAKVAALEAVKGPIK